MQTIAHQGGIHVDKKCNNECRSGYCCNVLTFVRIHRPEDVDLYRLRNCKIYRHISGQLFAEILGRCKYYFKVSGCNAGDFKPSICKQFPKNGIPYILPRRCKFSSQQGVKILEEEFKEVN